MKKLNRMKSFWGQGWLTERFFYLANADSS
jgi:hypothetical protein